MFFLGSILIFEFKSLIQLCVYEVINCFFYKSLGRQIFFVLKLLAFANFTYQTIFCILAKITAKKSFSLENVFFMTERVE